VPKTGTRGQLPSLDAAEVLVNQATKSQSIGGRGGDEGPAHDGDCELSDCACANEYEVLQMDRLAGAHVDGVHRDDEGARVPRLHVDGRARGARSNASILQKSLA
jgi:hypothetical protein